MSVVCRVNKKGSDPFLSRYFNGYVRAYVVGEVAVYDAVATIGIILAVLTP